MNFDRLLSSASTSMKWMVAAGVLVTIIGASTVDTNDAGYRTVVQFPNGTMKVQFDPGFFVTWFGKTTIYPDYLTYDFSASDNSCDYLQNDGIRVRYSDGGNGVVCGMARVKLPGVQGSDTQMVAFHKAYRDEEGVRNKLLNQEIPKVLNLTAALMASEEAYATKRNAYISMARDQATDGLYNTKVETVSRKTGVLDAEGEFLYEDVEVSKIVEDKNKQPVHQQSTFKSQGLTVEQFDLKQWDFEPKTITQIDKKREATMAIITSKADADRAKQETITAEQEGLAKVMTAKYEKEVLKEQAIVDAEQKKAVATINAEQNVEVARQGQLEAEQHKLAAFEYEEQQLAKGRGDAGYKKLVMEADGYAALKIQAVVDINKAYAEEFGKQKWVSEINMGGANGETSTNSAMDMINLLSIKAAKDLNQDMSITKPVQ